ncbi:phosphatase PAP2 family protein [Flaviaesturariibacter aridisoli]|uniref:Phosphatase PAP2 family protein n=1 Tax=Flaviaesturariibacter aridisoli TaxID=2545761 RepID=A0A4R4DYK3_9BACT|nr:phosphatase PAP2 family protein [Flaviaesturariibacter aridisoli]TCZ66298.1 phosphatase PAP2 family protein [Flaviaesturariibacter aridisoli]
MKRSLCGLLFLFATLTASSQQPDSLLRKLDSLGRKTDSADKQINNTAPGAYNNATRLTPGSYFILLGSDIKQGFTKPFHMKGRDWRLLAEYAGATIALSFADKPIQKEGLKLRNQSDALRSVSSYVTNFGANYEVYVLGGLGLYGYVFKNTKMRTTTLLASQSYISSAIFSFTLKFLVGRQRPYVIDPKTGSNDPHRFFGPFSKPGGPSDNQSFPSGHTTAAFSAATVYALEYRDRPWVPILAYSAATLIGISRITENKHWATDVLAGAALGYATGRLVVNNYHRYAQIKTPGTRKASVSFNCRYQFGQLMPGMVYTFR